MEEEAEKLKMLQSEVEKQINSPQGVGKWFYLKFIFRVSFINEFFPQLVLQTCQLRTKWKWMEGQCSLGM